MDEENNSILKEKGSYYNKGLPFSEYQANQPDFSLLASWRKRNGVPYAQDAFQPPQPVHFQYEKAHEGMFHRQKGGTGIQ